MQESVRKYWQKSEEKNQVVNLIPAEDLEDLSSEQIDIDYDDYDEKLLISDKIEYSNFKQWQYPKHS